ncbi:MAG: Rieske (2Fe-2S) protein [Pseudorhodoplanes sp.]
MSNNWVRIGDEAQFPEGLHPITLGKQRLVIARLNSRLYAFDALCPHAQGPMERSEIEGAIVSCPLHAWRFDLEEGGKELHGYRSLSTYDVKVSDGQVFLAFSS